MKKGTIRPIPLQADLCLNKQKVDIEDFKGWNKCNAPVYGNCLSPLYKKNGDHHDIYIGDDYYDWTNGVLSKNGAEVLSGVGSKKIKKTKVNADYDSLAVSSDDKLTWAKISSSNTVTYSLYAGEEQTVTIANCTRIILVKAFEKKAYEMYGVVVLYLHTNGKYGYYVVWNDDGTDYESYGEGESATTWSDFNVTNPLIQVAVTKEHEFMVSFYADSGARLEKVDVKNVYAKEGEVYDNVTFEEEGSSVTHYNPINENVGISVSINSTEKKGFFARQQGGSTSDLFVSGAYLIQQTITLTLSRAASYDITINLWFKNASNEKIYKGNPVVFTAGETSKTITSTFYYYAKRGYSSSIYTSEVRYVYNENGTVVQSSSLPSGFFYFPTWIYQDAGSEINYSTFGFDYTYTTEEDPDNTTTPSNLVTKTGSIDNRVTLMSNGFVCPGIVANSNVNYSFQNLNVASRTYNTATFDWIIAQMASLSTSQATSVPWFQKPNQYKIGIGAMHSGSDIIFSPPTDWYVYGNSMPPFYNENSRTGCIIPDYAYATLNRYVKEAFINVSLKDVDCCMDDGKFYCSGAITQTPDVALPQKLVALSGVFLSFNATTKKISYTATSTFSVQYDVDESVNVFPKYYVGMVLSLSSYLFKVIYFFKAKASDTEYISIMINSLEVGEGVDACHLYPGVQKDLNTNIQGGVKNTTATTGWRLLFNNNMLSNIGCYERKEYMGTILCDWFTINEDFCPAFNDDTLYYKDNSENIWKLELVTSGEEWQYKVLEDRYIVLNTTNYMNCYDTKEGLKRHYASDYNNRVMFGFAFTHYSNNEIFRQKLTTPLFRGLLITGQNANYEMTKDAITGLELGAVLYERCLKDDRSFISCEFPYGAIEGIDLYRGDGDSTSAIYVSSYANGLHYINTDLINPYAPYPIAQNGNIRYNPNLFTEIVRSYNNKDMVISDGTAYKLLYYNNVVPVLSFFLLDGVEEIDNVFVLQSSFYGVSKTRLYQMNYSEGVSVDVIADITNMEYLGALPSQALFWSAQNRAIYTFQGNCIMKLMQYANDLTAIFGKWYNPATQELFLDTNIGILVFSDLGTYCLEWDNETSQRTVADMFFFKDRFYINLLSDTSYTYYYSYNNLEGYESNKIKFTTKYYGNGKTPITVNNVYIRLYNQGVANAEGSIIFKGHTVTDIGTHTDTKTVAIGGVDDPTANPPTVAGEQWDSETNTMLVKYTPQYNRGLGFSLEVETTFPIIDIKFDYVDDVSTESQISHINI